MYATRTQTLVQDTLQTHRERETYTLSQCTLLSIPRTVYTREYVLYSRPAAIALGVGHNIIRIYYSIAEN